MITKGIKQLCADAEAVVETWTVDEAHVRLDDDQVEELEEALPRCEIEY